MSRQPPNGLDVLYVGHSLLRQQMLWFGLLPSLVMQTTGNPSSFNASMTSYTIGYNFSPLRLVQGNMATGKNVDGFKMWRTVNYRAWSASLGVAWFEWPYSSWTLCFFQQTVESNTCCNEDSTEMNLREESISSHSLIFWQFCGTLYSPQRFPLCCLGKHCCN